nr:immunoglobulin light chain junction region [Macaca mulatta]MOV34051.1 immunoglobulin light chain junction region [Macaca mulatta]MOV34217.1 immunoglobulin light chain junction region [Macaca mulatta]MOV34247.1 immunoglobulin light chain junction region [Macaca mulatta]MOV34374.1 immunoglobulin light chain junction region [Macaca mulatta]
CQKYSSPPHSF